MSTKTSFKRIALVAASALAIAGFSAVPAHAATTITGTPSWNVDTAYAGTGTTAGTQVVGGLATLTFSETATVTSATSVIGSVVSSGVGTIGSVAAGTGTPVIAPLGAVTGTVTYPTTSVSLAKAVASEALYTASFTVTSAVAGTQTLTASVYDANGTVSASYTATITWVAAGTSVGVSAANSTIYTISTSGTCTKGASNSKAADLVAAAANAAAISSVPAGTDYKLCVIARDASGNPVTLTTSSIATSSAGLSQALAAGSEGLQTETMGAALSTVTGKSTITAILIDTYGNVATLTTSLTYYGSLASIKLANIDYSAYAAADQTTDAGLTYALYAANKAADSDKGIVAIVGLDALGNTIDLEASPATSQGTWTIESDGTAGTAAVRTSDSLGASIAQTAGNAGELASSSFGTNVAFVDCSTKAEKLTLTAWAKNSAGAWVSSNSIDFYCATGASKIVVTPSAASGNANEAITVDVMVTDAQGYPVPDGTSLTLAASNGGVAAPSSATTTNGAFDTKPTLILGQGDTTITAIKGSKSGSATIAVDGGTASSSALALDAANAATDAANNAYDEAQNATQAASDALAAVTALAAQVKSLIASVKKLTAAVAKLKK